MLNNSHKSNFEDLRCRHYVAQNKGINVLVYKPVHRYAVALLRNSRFHVKFNRVAVDRFIAHDAPPVIQAALAAARF